MSRRATALPVALAALVIGGSAMAMAGRTIWDGVYTDAQATAGAARYAQQCARCHGAALYGTNEIPSLRGMLIARWGNGPLDRLSAYINRAMPMQSPGALPPAANAEILAYILKMNGARPGATPLATDPAELRGIAVTGKPVGAP